MIPDIRPLEAADLRGALALSTSAGWNQRPEDWTLLACLAGGRAFAAVAGQQVVGTAMALDYGGFAWIAMMLVDPVHRGRGLGARLLEAALDTVADRQVRLDATPAGRPLYLKYGFRDEARLTRSVIPASRTRVASVSGRLPRPLTADDLSAILSLDRDVFGGDRGAVLRWALAQAPGSAWVRPGGSVPSYCFGRPGRLFDQIGPIVADDDAGAAALASAALAAAGDRAVVVDAYDDRPGFTAWLRARGFTGERPLFRMRRGTPQGPATGGAAPHTREFAIAGPDLA